MLTLQLWNGIESNESIAIWNPIGIERGAFEPIVGFDAR